MNRPTYRKEKGSHSTPANGCPRLIIDVCKIHLSGELSPLSIAAALENGLNAFFAESHCKEAIEVLERSFSDWNGDRPFFATSVNTELQKDQPGNSFVENIVTTTAGSILSRLPRLVDLLIIKVPPDDSASVTTDGIVKAFRKINRSGITALAGFSAMKYRDILTSNRFDFFMGHNRLDACNLDALERDIPFLRENKIGYISSSPLHLLLMGSMLGQYSRERPSMPGLSEKDITTAVMASRIARKNLINLEEMAYRYLFSIEEAASVMAKPATINELGKIIEYWNRGPLNEELFNDISDNILKFCK